MDPASLANAGGLALFVAAVAAIGAVLTAGKFVQRLAYDREVSRNDLLAAANTGLISANRELSAAFKDVVGELKEVRAELRAREQRDGHR